MDTACQKTWLQGREMHGTLRKERGGGGGWSGIDCQKINPEYPLFYSIKG